MKANEFDPIREGEAISPGSIVFLRLARAADADLLFNWRNLPEIVALSSSNKKVSRSEHQKWYSETLQSPARLLFIVTENAMPIGQMRFDLVSELEAEVSIYLISIKTGQGLGTTAIKQGCAHLFNRGDIQRVIAHVRDENNISLSAFRKNGFFIDTTGTRRQGHMRLVLKLR